MKTVHTFLAFVFLAFAVTVHIPGQSALPENAGEETSGDSAIAERYVIWAEGELATGRVERALAGLERGADYASVSADLLYLLAKIRLAAGRPARTALDACEAALENGRWSRYNGAVCRLLEAEILIQLRQYDDALALLYGAETDRVPLFLSSEPAGGRGVQELAARQDGADALLLRLRCRMGLGQDREFILLMKEAMDRYPRDPRFPRLLFAFCRNHPPDGAALTRDLVSLSLKRLSFLIEDDPGLAYLAAPFIANPGEAARSVAAYRALGNPNPACLPSALLLGLSDDAQAVTELFAYRAVPGSGGVLERGLVLDVWAQLRAEEGRDAFRRNLLGYSGVIKEDEDGDGFFEIAVSYRDGLIAEYAYDADQDRVPEWNIAFNAGVPVRAELGAGEEKAAIRWERYPAVLFAELSGVRYIPRPADFSFTPLRFAELVRGGPLYPERDALDTVITERGLLSFAVMTERPSAEFPGGVERTEFQGSVPVSSKTYLGEKLVTETDFVNGRPYAQRADMDNDGRMETIRHFSHNEYGVVISSESDWDGDGIYEYAEVLQSDGTVKKYWDLDKDGTRETER